MHWVPQPSLIHCGGFPLAETSCAATEFRCRDGSCIGNSSRCNQFIDCEDASDEMNCSECPSCCPMFPAASPALPCCSSGDAPALCACGRGPGSMHLVSVFGTCAESGREKGPGSHPVSRGQPRLARRLEAAPAHHCSPPRRSWQLTTQQPVRSALHGPSSSGHTWGRVSSVLLWGGKGCQQQGEGSCCAVGAGPKGCAASEQRPSLWAPAVVPCSRH